MLANGQNMPRHIQNEDPIAAVFGFQLPGQEVSDANGAKRTVQRPGEFVKRTDGSDTGHRCWFL